MPEYKSFPQSTKQIEDRTVTGIAAVHGNVDAEGDRSWPGSFGDFKVDGRSRVRFLWQHSPWDPPTAGINYIREVPKSELPSRVLEYAPDATGGVEVSRTYLDTPRANEVLEGIKAGAIDEMSYAYDVENFDIETDEETGEEIRNLRKISLWDLSDVLFGMNSATAASKGWPWPVSPERLKETLSDECNLLDGLRFDEHSRLALAASRELGERALAIHTLRAKEGRVLSSANRRRIKALVKSLQKVTTDLQQLLEETDPDKAAENAARVRQLHAEFLQIESELLGAMA